MNKVKLSLSVLTLLLSSLSSTAIAYMEEGSLTFAKCEEYINVRTEANTNSDIVSLLYNNCPAIIINDLDNGWCEIEYDGITGFVMSEYLTSRYEDEEYIMAIVLSDGLNIRKNADHNSEILYIASKYDEFKVLDFYDEWLMVYIDEDTFGYINSNYCDIYYPTETQNFEYAYNDDCTYDFTCCEICNEYQEEVIEYYQYDYIEKEEYIFDNEKLNYIADDKFCQNEQLQYGDINSDELLSNITINDGKLIVDYASNFIGNPYVWGGTSLTDGSDCSGFTQSVYENFGININRVAADQASGGVSINLDDIQAGDLLFYSDNGSEISHVAIYAGNGEIIHSSNSEQGVIISDAYYDTPVYATRYW